MDSQWARLRTYQRLQNRLLAELGPPQTNITDTVSACQGLLDLDPEDRPEYIRSIWGALTDKVSQLLGQLKALEQQRHTRHNQYTDDCARHTYLARR